MRIAFIGTRGVPARYGGFETAAEEIGARLVAAGHEVVVYCRGGDPTQTEHRGMRLVHRRAVRHKVAETLSHTALSLVDQLRRPCDVAVVFNAANAPLLPLLKARRIPAAVHVDGLEWQRAKWGPAGRRYYQAAERSAVRRADALIADARGIQAYYDDVHRAPTWFIPYGAPDTSSLGSDRLAAVGAQPGGYHLVVARMEPENNVELVLHGYQQSSAALPLLVVGGASYNQTHWDAVQALAGRDPRVRMLGPVWDQALLDQLYVNALTYLHGHSVGGTNPSLLRAVGAGAPVIAFDVSFNREVLGDDGCFFTSPQDVTAAVEDAEASPAEARERGLRAHKSVLERYDWDQVAADYGRLCAALLEGRGWQPPPDLYDGDVDAAGRAPGGVAR